MQFLGVLRKGIFKEEEKKKLCLLLHRVNFNFSLCLIYIISFKKSLFISCQKSFFLKKKKKSWIEIENKDEEKEEKYTLETLLNFQLKSL